MDAYYFNYVIVVCVITYAISAYLHNRYLLCFIIDAMIYNRIFCVFFEDPRDEFVVSPEYFVQLVPQCANLINAIKLKFAKSAKPLKTIDRRELFRVGIHKVFKSKNKLQNLQKYWERSERRRLKREQKVRFIQLCS